MSKRFEGVINLDNRDSQPDWCPYLADKAPEDAPNVLIVLYHDTYIDLERQLMAALARD
jgi:hypothetical protein